MSMIPTGRVENVVYNTTIWYIGVEATSLVELLTTCSAFCSDVTWSKS